MIIKFKPVAGGKEPHDEGSARGDILSDKPTVVATPLQDRNELVVWCLVYGQELLTLWLEAVGSVQYAEAQEMHRRNSQSKGSGNLKRRP